MSRVETRPLEPHAGDCGQVAQVESIRRDLATRLRARSRQIEEAALARFQDIGFDPATGEDADYVAGSRAAVIESVEYSIRAVEAGEDWFGSIPPALVAQAHRAARNGVNLDNVLLRANAGHTVLEDFIMQEIDFRAEQRIVLRGVFQTLAALLDHVTALIAHEYQRESERVTRSPELRRIEHVQKLLGGSLDTAGLEYRLDAWHLGIIARGAKAGETVRALAAGLGRDLLSVPADAETVWGWFGGGRPLEIDKLERLLSVANPRDVSFAVGAPASGIEGWRLTHRQSQAALLVAQRRPQALTRYADVALLAAVLNDTELAGSLVAIHLAPVKGGKDNGASCKTLRAYFASECNAATAAALLGVNRHTIERRLNAIETRLGRSLHTCRAELEVALALDELEPTRRARDDHAHRE